MKHADEQAVMLRSNKVTVKGDIPTGVREKLKEDLINIAAQKANKRLFGFLPVKLWFYAAAGKGKDTRFRKWLKTRVGEAPVLLDTALCNKSIQLFENYLFNGGYFAHQVEAEVLPLKNKRARVHYHVKVEPGWKLGKISFPEGKTEYEKRIVRLSSMSLLRSGDLFEITKLKAERDRIEKDLKNIGYFFFSRDYVNFTLDSATEKNKVNVSIRISPPTDSTLHKTYSIRKVFVYEDFSAEIGLLDTAGLDTIYEGNVYFIQRKNIVTSKRVLEALYLRPGTLYSQELHNKSLRRLNDMGIFRFITMEYDPVPDSLQNLLDCRIFLTPAKQHSFGASGEINVNIEGFLGLAGTLSYRNKNLSRRADLFSVDLSGGVQFLFLKQKEAKPLTWDLGLSSSYTINRIGFPFPVKKRAQLINPKTFFSLSYNFESRYELDENTNRAFLYNLHNFNFGFGYDWSQNRFIRHSVNPININFFIFPQKGETFIERLAQNPSLQNNYAEQFVLGPSYTFLYADQLSNTDRRYFYYRLNVEVVGNLFYAGFALADLASNVSKPYRIFDRAFSQFLRTDHDYRAYVRMSRHSSFVWRGYAGIGFAYGNSNQMPFIKQFFVGGPNSLRGFNIREIGPGGYVDTTIYNSSDASRKNFGFFNQTGDIKLETNAEIRFDIYKWLKGAVFVDAGNVWLMRKDPSRPNAEFNFKRFWNEFALDVGAGIRMDFSFFVIRFDYGFPIRDPRRAENSRWTFQRGQFQLAVGYPF